VKWFVIHIAGARKFENKELKKIFGPKRDEVTRDCGRMHNAYFYNMYSSPNIVRI
jgi:hypothetical protein